MQDVVAVDASPEHQGDRYFILGIALEIEDTAKFDEYYFDIVNEFNSRHDIDTEFPVIKSSDILDYVPGYELRDEAEGLARDLAGNPAINRIQVCIGYYPEDVHLSWEEESRSPMDFAKSYLEQYFPVVALWSYHRENRHHGPLPDVAWVDQVQGRITKAWQYVGNEFEVKLIPHGDLTYPCISTADILGSQLSRTMPSDRPLSELANAAKGWLLDYADEDAWIEKETINEDNKEHIVPDFRYSIRSQIHHPHPVTYIQDDILNTQVLPDHSDLFSLARRNAYQENGCVTGLMPDQPPEMLRDGDKIIHTGKQRPDEAQVLKDINPTKEVTVVEANSFLASLMER